MELVRKTVRITPELNKRMKIGAIQLGISEQDLMEKALIKFLGGSKMNLQDLVGTMWSDSAGHFNWLGQYPQLDESGKIIAVVSDIPSDLVIVCDEFVCEPEIAEALIEKFGLDLNYYRYTQVNEQKDPS